MSGGGGSPPPPVLGAAGAKHPHRWGFLLLGIALLVTLLVPRSSAPLVKEAGHFFSHPFHDTYLVVGLVYLLYLAFAARSKAFFWRIATVIGVETLVMQTIQKVSFYGFGLWPRPSGTDGGFPSGHTAVTCALAYLLSDRYPRLSVLFYAGAAFVGWSRWEDGAHYPYQVVGGAVLGLACALIFSPRFPDPPFPERV